MNYKTHLIFSGFFYCLVKDPLNILSQFFSLQGKYRVVDTCSAGHAFFTISVWLLTMISKNQLFPQPTPPSPVFYSLKMCSNNPLLKFFSEVGLFAELRK